MTPPAGARPPRWLERLLEWRLPPDFRGVVAGDLAEEFVDRADSAGMWPWLRAVLWYAGQVIRVDASALQRATTTTNGTWARDEGRPTSERITTSGVIDMLMQDVKYAMRRLWKSPGFTLVAVLTLGLGIGANSALFTLVNAIFRADDGITEPDRVTRIYWDGTNPYWSISWDWYQRIGSDLPDVFAHTTAYRILNARSEVTGDVLLPALFVSGDYFGTMGVEPVLGRAFEPGVETDAATGPNVVVVAHRFWEQVLGGDPEALGETLRIDATPHTIVGVLPPGFEGPMTGIEIDLYLPDRRAVRNASNDFLIGAGRLAPGVGVDEARAATARIAEALNRGRPADRTPIAFNLVPESEISVDPQVDRIAARTLALLFGVVGLVLVIACTNLASFLLTRAADRRREFAVRRAMGAARSRVVAQLLVESLILALLGGVVGVIMAQIALEGILRIELPVDIGLRLQTGVDAYVLLTTLGVTALAGILFGLFPALTAGREEVAPVLRDESAGAAGGRGKVTLRGTLVVAQVSLSLALLIGAGLFVRSLMTMTAIDPGFDREARAMVTVDPGSSGYETAAATRMIDRALDRVREMPDVEVATIASRVPMQPGIWRSGIRRADQPFSPTRTYTSPQVTYTGGRYFEALGIDLVAGRMITDQDRVDTPPVVVVNQALAEQLWPGEGRNVVGRSVILSSLPDSIATIVGLAPDVKVAALDEDPVPVMYVPIRQVQGATALIIARGRGATAAGESGALSLAQRMRTEVKALDADMYVHSATTVADATDAVLFLPRLGAIALALFGALAVAMATIGLYGLVAFGVKRREKEVGIRLSLGADPGEIVRMMMRSGTRLVVAGVAIGMVLGVAAGFVLESFLFGVSKFDPVTLVFVPSLLIAVSIAASWIPARRAATIDPVESLRNE